MSAPSESSGASTSSGLKWVTQGALLLIAAFLGAVGAQILFSSQKNIDALYASNATLQSSLNDMSARLDAYEAQIKLQTLSEQFIGETERQLEMVTSSQSDLQADIAALQQTRNVLIDTKLEERILEVEQKLSAALIRLSEVQPPAGAPRGADAATINQLQDFNRDLERLQDIITRVEIAIGNNSQDIVTLTQRLSAQQKQINALTDTSKEKQQAQSALFNKLNRIEKIYQFGGATQDIFSQITADFDALDKLAPTANPSLKQLAQASANLHNTLEGNLVAPDELKNSFTRLAAPMIKMMHAAQPPQTFQQRLTANMLSLVNGRPYGLAQGTDVSSQIARIEYMLGRSLYNEATLEWQKLPAKAKQMSEKWHTQLQARLQLDAFLKKTRTLITQFNRL